ncbi:MAG: MFS transporter [Planctomycetes bacterium]|nr:MFS transporter [Planctomycetota bacterium]
MNAPPMLSPAPEDANPTQQQRRGMRSAIVAQIFACFAYLAFSNGLLLLYFKAHDFSGSLTMTLLALLPATQFVVLLPSAYWADRRGKRRAGLIGIAANVAGFTLLTCTGWLSGTAAAAGIVAGLTVYSLGYALNTAVWYALLSPVVPPGMRGGFFGKLRLTWQSAGIVFGIACTWILTEDSPMIVFQAIFAICTVALAVRTIFYARIPELEQPRQRTHGLRNAVLEVMRTKGFTSFACYIFLLALFTSNAPALFGLIEKEALRFSDKDVAWMGNLLMAGSVGGFVIGGKMVDRLGTKPVFLLCHFSFALVLWCFLLRGLIPLPPPVLLGALNAAFGGVTAASSIAISSELLALAPYENKALATAFCMTLFSGGQAMSGWVSAGAVKLGIFAERWGFLGQELGPYDALLLVFGVLVVLLVVSLGLVPSVIAKAQWVPKGD